MTNTEINLRHCPKCGNLTSEAHCPNDGIATILRQAIDTSSTQIRTGDVVAGKYRITGLLGRGGFGAVCSAEHTGTGQSVALKYLALDPEQSEDDVVKRFFQEARVTASLKHPNTVRVFDFGQAENGALYMAMEMLHGKSLERVLKDHAAQGTFLSEPEIIDVALPILAALSEAHGTGLVHRDLKPANIMLCEVGADEPLVKVLDFGIARAKDSSLTGGAKSMGTPAYMSPEQCRGAQVDGRSDLYSLGIMMFRCAAGRLPYNDPNPLVLMMAHEREPLPDLKQLAGGRISDGLAEVITIVLSKAADDRFADAKSMRNALRAVQGGAWAGTPASVPAIDSGAVPALTGITGRGPSSSVVSGLGAKTGPSAVLPSVPAATPSISQQPAVGESAAKPPSRVWPIAVFGALVAVGVGAFLVLRPAETKSARPEAPGAAVVDRVPVPAPPASPPPAVVAAVPAPAPAIAVPAPPSPTAELQVAPAPVAAPVAAPAIAVAPPPAAKPVAKPVAKKSPAAVKARGDDFVPPP